MWDQVQNLQLQLSEREKVKNVLNLSQNRSPQIQFGSFAPALLSIMLKIKLNLITALK